MSEILFSLFEPQNIAEKLRAITAQTVMSSTGPGVSARQDALNTVAAWTHRDATGRPVLPLLTPEERDRLIDVAITAEERKVLGAAEPKVTLLWLQKLMELRLPEVQPALVQAQSLAAHLVATAPRDITRYRQHTNDQENAFDRANRAFTLLSRPVVTATVNPALQRGRDLLTALDAYQRTEGAGTQVYMTEAEFRDLRAGRLDTVPDNVFDGDEQTIRKSTNAVLPRMRNARLLTGTNFEFISEPQTMKKLIELSKLDTTASWMLDINRAHRIPIVLMRYIGVPINDRRTQAFYLWDTGRPIGDSAVGIFTNDANLLDLAICLGHENWHLQQTIRFPEQRQPDPYNPQNTILFNLFDEAGARAVHAKIAYNLSRKTGGRLNLESGENSFARRLNETAGRGYSDATRVRLATQEAFIDALNWQLKGSPYLDKFLEAVFSNPVAPMFITRPIDKSANLTDDFFKKMSQVSPSVSFLDADGINRIRALVSAKLPTAIGNYIVRKANNAYRAAGP